MKTLIVNGVKVPTQALIDQGWTPPEVKLKNWKPIEKEPYWFLGSNGNTYSAEYIHKDLVNVQRVEVGNAYPTKTAAKEVRDVQYVYVRIVDKLRELEGDFVTNWEDTNLIKCSAYYCFREKALRLTSSVDCSYTPPALISNKEAWTWVIENMKFEVKLMLGV